MNFDISTPDGMENAKAWQQDWLDKMKDGGVWSVPRSGVIITVDKVKKVATFQSLLGVSEPEVEKVFRAMGWRVVHKDA